MDSNGNFWVSMWLVVATTIVLVATITVSYYKDKNTQVVEAIKSGADPIEVVCALDNDSSFNQVCTILAAKK